MTGRAFVTPRDLRTAILAAGGGLAIVVLAAGIGLYVRETAPTSGGGGPRRVTWC